MKQLYAASLLSGLVLLLGAAAARRCGPQTPPLPLTTLPPSRTGQSTLQLATYADVGTLDPATSGDGLSALIFPSIYGSLFEIDDTGVLTPYLAQSYSSNADSRVYTFQLRPGLRFHDGSAFTAATFVASFERAAGPHSIAMSDGAFEHVLGLAEFRAGTAQHIRGVEALPSGELRVSLTRSDARFLSLSMLPAMRPVCPSAAAPTSTEFAPCGAGAFAVAPGGWVRGRELTMHRTHAESPPFIPNVEAVRWQFQTSSNTQRVLFLRGDLDMVGEVSYVDDMVLRAEPKWRNLLQFEPSREVYGEIMNTRMAPFDNVHIRRAVSYAIDRRKFERIKPGSMQGTAFPLPAAVIEDLAQLPCQYYDPTEALREMELAGYPYNPRTGAGGYPHTIPYLVYAQGVGEYSAQVVARDLEKIGLRVEIRVLSYQAYLAQAQRSGGSAISFGGWATDVPDAAAFLKPLFHSSAISAEDSSNAAFYANSLVDAALDEAIATSDAGMRHNALARAIHTLCEDAPWAFTFSLRAGIYTQGYVRGFRAHPATRYWPFHTSLVGGAP